MANEQRLIDANKARVVAQRIYSDPVLIHAILNTLDETPTVDAVEVVHGQWKTTRESEISRNVWCTACGKDFYMRRKGELQIDKMPYCPNCGAKMDGGKDNG